MGHLAWQTFPGMTACRTGAAMLLLTALTFFMPESHVQYRTCKPLLAGHYCENAMEEALVDIAKRQAKSSKAAAHDGSSLVKTAG